MYEYHAREIRVIDGDTLELDIDLGLFVHVHRHCRLLGINAPELHGETHEAGVRAKRRLAELVWNECLICRTSLDRDDKYGRVLVELWHEGEQEASSINKTLVDEGLAVEYS